ncbi:enoyl-CoA hydratase/isomerase family protein [Acidisoma sp.]|uniref:enoyl-CoA hydratase/isomerase family protein n=1 Tax=Acidisoma sp. TaxID=1872115 RepID=UPI003B00DE21
MFDLPVPVISIITGNCLGVGLFFVCAADVAIVDETAKLQVLDAGLGYYPGMALPFLLERKVGVQQASLLTMTQEAISAREAERFGLVARCLVAGSAFDEGMRLARAIAAAAPEVVKYNKRGPSGASKKSLVRDRGWRGPVSERLSDQGVSNPHCYQRRERCGGREGCDKTGLRRRMHHLDRLGVWRSFAVDWYSLLFRD